MPTHHSSEEDISVDEWMSSDYSPPWSCEKEDEDQDDADADTKDSDDDSDDFDFDSPPPKRARRA